MKKTAGAVCAVSAIIAIVLSMDTGLRTNKEGLELIGNAESCRRDPYMCPAAVWTDGMGNTHGVVPGVRKTDEQIAKDFAKNVAEAEACINKNFNGSDMNDNQFSAMSSAAYNMGCGSLMFYRDKNGKRVRTTIWKMAQARNWNAMCDRLHDFNKVSGKEIRGLTIRRHKEYLLCTK